MAGEAATGEVEEESEELREVKVEWREEQSLEGLKRRRMELDQAEEEEEQVHVPEEEEEVSQQQQEVETRDSRIPAGVPTVQKVQRGAAE